MSQQRTQHTNASQTSSVADVGEIRLMQAYLRALGQFGDPNKIRGVDVVSGTLTTNTRVACERFMTANRSHCALASDEQVNRVIATLRHAHSTIINVTSGVDDSLAGRTALARAFESSSQSKRYPALAALHPQMRFPLAAALDTLAHRGITIVLHEGYRPPHQQEALVMQGLSTAVPFWSLHGYGLAMDMTPRSASDNDVLNPQSAAWQATFNVMHYFGFDSLYKNQGWDLPHFEIPAKTATLMSWPNGRDGYKDIPDNAIPAAWRSINARALGRLEQANQSKRAR
jgi:D-alanyl-D-alanine dipeptidase